MALSAKDLCESVKPPTYLCFFTASCSIFISIVASVGNFLVVFAVIWNPYKDLQKPFHYFVANLAIADLVVGVILGPLSSIVHIFEGLDILTQPFKVAIRVVYLIFCTTSLLSLTALTLERYLAIMHPTICRNNLSPVRTLLVFTLLWIFSIQIAMIYLIVGYYKCRLILANITLGVVIFEVIFTNVKILKHLRHQMQQWDALRDSSEENLLMKQLMMWEKKMTKTLRIVIFLFLAFYLPSCVFMYIVNLANCDCIFVHWIRDIQFLLVMTTSAVNPFVYAMRLENFRRVFRRILTCRVCRSDGSGLNHNHYEPL